MINADKNDVDSLNVRQCIFFFKLKRKITGSQKVQWLMELNDNKLKTITWILFEYPIISLSCESSISLRPKFSSPKCIYEMLCFSYFIGMFHFRSTDDCVYFYTRWSSFNAKCVINRHIIISPDHAWLRSIIYAIIKDFCESLPIINKM